MQQEMQNIVVIKGIQIDIGAGYKLAEEDDQIW